MHLTLDDLQEEAVAKMTAEPTRAALLAADLGTGKTVMSVELAKRIGAKTILVIAPLNTRGSVKKQDGWEYTFHRQGVDLPFLNIDGKTPENFDRLRAGEPGVYFVGREFFHLSATTLPPKKRKDGSMTRGRKARWSWSKVKPDLAIFDEVHAASNRNSDTYTALRTLKAGYKIASSATPQRNQFTGMWSITRWLWPDVHKPDVPYDPDFPYRSMYVDNSFWRWAAQWAVLGTDPFAGTWGSEPAKKVMGELVPGAFVASLPCYIRIEAVKTPVVKRRVRVDLTPTQRRLYDEMEANMLTWIDQHPLVAKIPIVKRVRMRQITLGEPTVVYTGGVDEDGAPEFIVDFAEDCESAKIDALNKIISKFHPEEPIFILVDSQKFATVVAARLGPLAVEWSGRTSQKERVRIKSEFGHTVRYIVAVIPAVAEGLDGLQKVCNVEVWLSESLDGVLNEQAEGRLNRRGQPAAEIIQYKIQARDTDDDGHFERLAAQRMSNKASLNGRRS